ncbi:MAG: hypothetical protein SVV03_06195 [Candidatus Nanohaloarchaea archaeon]|nr:hypothetical protein [Candidatus Nanohaloarchaea archaeon]
MEGSKSAKGEFESIEYENFRVKIQEWKGEAQKQVNQGEKSRQEAQKDLNQQVKKYKNNHLLGRERFRSMGNVLTVVTYTGGRLSSEEIYSTVRELRERLQNTYSQDFNISGFLKSQRDLRDSSLEEMLEERDEESHINLISDDGKIYASLQEERPIQYTHRILLDENHELVKCARTQKLDMEKPSQGQQQYDIAGMAIAGAPQQVMVPIAGQQQEPSRETEFFTSDYDEKINVKIHLPEDDRDQIEDYRKLLDEAGLKDQERIPWNVVSKRAIQQANAARDRSGRSQGQAGLRKQQNAGQIQQMFQSNI